MTGADAREIWATRLEYLTDSIPEANEGKRIKKVSASDIYIGFIILLYYCRKILQNLEKCRTLKFGYKKPII